MNFKQFLTERKFHFFTDCTDSCHGRDGEHISNMADKGREVSWKTILRNCDGAAQWAKDMGYGRHLKIEDDYAVSFYKSKYRGVPCYYIKHSMIEYVWLAHRNFVDEEEDDDDFDLVPAYLMPKDWELEEFNKLRKKKGKKPLTAIEYAKIGH